MRVILAEEAAVAGKDPPIEDSDDYDIYDLDSAWLAWQWWNSSDGKTLPNGGGLLEQDEQLINDMMTIQWRKKLLELHHKANKAIEANG